MSEWQTIETAPKDGTEILLWYADGQIWVAAWCAREGEWQDRDDGWQVSWPSFWMPLPKPPEAA